MADIVIPSTFGEGGAHLTPAGSSGDPNLKTILQQLATKANAVTGTATITAPALPAFTDPPTAGEMAALRTLVNQIRTALTSA